MNGRLLNKLSPPSSGHRGSSNEMGMQQNDNAYASKAPGGQYVVVNSEIQNSEIKNSEIQNSPSWTHQNILESPISNPMANGPPANRRNDDANTDQWENHRAGSHATHEGSSSHSHGGGASPESSINSSDTSGSRPAILEASEVKGMRSYPAVNKRLQIPFRTLNSGHICPGIGYGTGGEGRATPDELYAALRVAIDAGYRSFDSAPFYQDGLVEQTVGRALRDSGVDRSEFFITTKVWPTFARCPEESLDLSLRNMDIDYVDCLLLHWPIPLRPVPDDPYAMGGTWDAGWSFNKAWVKMQEIPTSKVRSIGVCNFTINRLRLLLASPTTKVVPAVLQVEGHPELPQNPLMTFCRQHRIQVFCYAPLAQGQFSNTLIQHIAQKHNTGSGQVALSWAIQRGTVPLPKSVNTERIRSNMELVCLDADDFKLLETLGRNPRRMVNPRILFGHDIFENNADSYEPNSKEPKNEDDEVEDKSLPRKRKAI